MALKTFKQKQEVEGKVVLVIDLCYTMDYLIGGVSHD